MTPLEVAEPAYARQLTDRIKIAVEDTWELIKEAYVSRAWSALSYSNWDDYCTREFGTPRLRLPREERQEVVGSLREAGLSIRAIAAATGDSRDTVHKALNPPVRNLTPESAPIVTTCPDCGNELNHGEMCAGCYPPAYDADSWNDADDETALTEEECEALADPADLDDEPAPTVTGIDGKQYPASKPRAAIRKPITDSFWTAAYDLGRKVGTLANLVADDRFTKNADQLRDKNLSDLIRARDGLQSVIDQLTSH